MKALFGVAPAVPLSRVMGDYRHWIVPILAALAVALAVLMFVVLPMTASADAAEQRAAAAVIERQAAADEFAAAEATRDAQSQSATDLDTFYAEVLPADVRAAARVMTLKLSQLAREHDVTFQRTAASPETLQKSSLERLHATYALAGDYDDIRRMIYDIETSEDFIVIDNVFLSQGQGTQGPLALTLDLSTFYRTANAR